MIKDCFEMVVLDFHIDAVKRIDKQSLMIASSFPNYKGKDHSMISILGHITKYWNKGDTDLFVKHGLTKPSLVSKYVKALSSGENICPLLCIVDKHGIPCLSLMCVVPAVDKSAEPIQTLSGKHTFPYKLDINGKIEKTVEPKRITKWSVNTLIKLILQNDYFTNVCKHSSDYNLEEQEASIKELIKKFKTSFSRTNKIRAEKPFKLPKPHLISVPMGGMTRYKRK